MSTRQSPGPGGLRNPVSPGAASLESFARTAVSMAVGAGLTFLGKWLGDRFGISIDLSDQASEVVTGIVWALVTALYASVQRKFWPIQTDAPGSARTDLTAGGKRM